MTAPKVLYIGGTGRSGSTVLDRLLGSIDGWFSGGELAFLWRHGLGNKGRCTCGEPLASCPLWSMALADAGITEADGERMVELRRRFWSVHLPLMVSERTNNRFLDRLGEFPQTVERLYRAVAERSQSRVIVDSSKEPHYAWILRQRTSLDVYFLHLVRDPRAIAHSWQRKRVERGLTTGQLMDQRPSPVAAAYFNVSNGAGEALWRDRPDRYRFLRYEDFVADPAATVEALAEFVGEEVSIDDVLADRTFQPGPAHSAWGNPNRFNTDPITLRDDAAWRTELSPIDAAISSGLTSPLSSRYGYPLFDRSDPDAQPRAQRLRDLQLFPSNANTHGK